MPPCMTTSVWPSDAIASADANGSIVRSAPLLRLDDANTPLAANRATVATRTVARPRESTLSDPRGIASRATPPDRVLCASRAHVGGDSNAPAVVHKGRSNFNSAVRSITDRGAPDALDTADSPV